MDSYHQNYLPPDSTRDIVWTEISKYLDRFVTNHGSVLELGAGYCSFINAVRFRRKVAIDLWPGFKKYARQGVVCLVMDVRDKKSFKFKEKFDLIMASNLLEHLTMAEVNSLLSACRMMLSENGRIVLIQPNFALCPNHYFDDYTHKTIFTDTSLKALLRFHKYNIEHEEPRFLPLTFKSRLPKWGFLTRFYLSLPWRPFAGQMLVIASKPRTKNMVRGKE